MSLTSYPIALLCCLEDEELSVGLLEPDVGNVKSLGNHDTHTLFTNASIDCGDPYILVYSIASCE